MKITKATLVRRMAEKSELSQSQTRAALDALLATVSQALAESETVQLPPLGSFKIGFRAPRTMRNPQTGQPMDVPATRQVVFSPSKQLKTAVS